MKRTVLALLALLLLSGSGCKNRLVFVTHTSVGLDISGTANYPNKISFSHNRFEAAIVPRKTDGSGESHSVYGGMDSDVKFSIPPKYRIEQVFATGHAAALAASRDASERSGAAPAARVDAGHQNNRSRGSSDTAPLVFMTGTTLGIHFTVGEQELNPSALVGYRRSEATIIPIVEKSKEVRSVYADIHLSSREDDALKAAESDEVAEGAGATPPAKAVADERKVSQWGGVRIKQSFATGQAAEILASENSEAQTNLMRAAGLSASAGLKELKQDNEKLGKSAGDIIDNLPDSKLEAAGQAAIDADILRGTIEDFKKLSPSEQRQTLKNAAAPTGPRTRTKVKKFLLLIKAP